MTYENDTLSVHRFLYLLIRGEVVGHAIHWTPLDIPSGEAVPVLLSLGNDLPPSYDDMTMIHLRHVRIDARAVQQQAPERSLEEVLTSENITVREITVNEEVEIASKELRECQCIFISEEDQKEDDTVQFEDMEVVFSLR